MRIGQIKNNKIALKSFDFNRHSLILGQSGSGKSFLAKLMIEDLYRDFSEDYSVVLIDPHANLTQLVGGVSPQKVINFEDTQTNLFLNVGQPVLSTELTLDLFSTVLKIKENPNLLRTLKYSLSLLFSINKMNFANLKKLLTDSVERKELIKQTDDPAISKFFDTEYQEMRTSHYNTAVLPIINLVSELDFVERVENKVNLPDALNNNFLVSFPINQAKLGTNVTKVIGAAIIQQVFTLMQAQMTMDKVFQDLYELVWKEVFPDYDPLDINLFKKLYTKDLFLPEPRKSDLGDGTVYLSQVYKHKQLASKDELDAKESWTKPKSEISSLTEILSSLKDISYFKVGRAVNSEVYQESDTIYSSNYVFNSIDLHGCQKMMFCNGASASEYLLASKGSGKCSFGIRIIDSGNVSNSFDMDNCGKCSNSYFCQDCGDLRDCMFCFHTSSKRFCIGNTQFEEQEYYTLKKKILDEYFAQLDKPNAFVTLSDL